MLRNFRNISSATPSTTSGISSGRLSGLLMIALPLEAVADQGQRGHDADQRRQQRSSRGRGSARSGRHRRSTGSLAKAHEPLQAEALHGEGAAAGRIEGQQNDDDDRREHEDVDADRHQATHSSLEACCSLISSRAAHCREAPIDVGEAHEAVVDGDHDGRGTISRISDSTDPVGQSSWPMTDVVDLLGIEQGVGAAQQPRA